MKHSVRICVTFLLCFCVKGMTVEPSVQEVMTEAIKFSRLENSPLVSLSARVRQAPWLPSIRTKFVRQADFGESIKLKVGEASTRVERDFSDFGFEVEAKWEFDKLLFSPDELAVAKENGRVFAQRDQLVNKVVEAYFGRQFLLVELRQQTNAQQKIFDKLKIDEFSAKLDALTGGWFSQHLEAHQ